MKIVLNNVHGLEGNKAYYRLRGCCFEFTDSYENATELAPEVAKEIVERDNEMFKEQYKADSVEIIK